MNILNEAFSSKKLAALAKQHGGIEISINGGMRNGANAFHGGSSVDVSKITDEMLSGEPFKYDYKNTPDKVAANLIHFKDGYAISLRPYDLKSDNNINPERPRQKPSRYGTGIGDTGDHNKKESPFFKNGKKDVGPEYNGFGVSSRAGESQHYREAIKNNKNDIKYYEEHPDGEYSKNAINRAKKNIQTIKGYGKDLLNKKKNESKNMKQTIKLNESELKNIVAESVKIILKESFIGGDNQFDDNVAQKAQSPSDVFKMNYWTGRTESKGNGELILRCYTDNNSMATRNYPDFEKVVNDLNQYYKLHGSKSIAQALPDDGVSRGRLLKITKRPLKEGVLGQYEDDNYLGINGANRAFGSDENYITMSIPSDSDLKNLIDKKMSELGYKYYDMGTSENKIIITYKKIEL